jgi:hypothetical protein
MPFSSGAGRETFAVLGNEMVLNSDESAFAPLTADDIRQAFAVSAGVRPILSFDEAADLVAHILRDVNATLRQPLSSVGNPLGGGAAGRR